MALYAKWQVLESDLAPTQGQAKRRLMRDRANPNRQFGIFWDFDRTVRPRNVLSDLEGSPRAEFAFAKRDLTALRITLQR